VAKFFAKLPPSWIGLEACGAAHHWARLLGGLGHAVVLLPPQYIKPMSSVAERRIEGAICEAMSRPRFCADEDAPQQAGLMLLRTRDLWVKQRTMLINAIRGHAAEFGRESPQRAGQGGRLLQQAHGRGGRGADAGSGDARPSRGQLDTLEARAEDARARLMACTSRPGQPMLGTQPGIGPIGAVIFALKIPIQRLSLGPALRRLARSDAEGARDRRAPPRPDQPAGDRPAPAPGARATARIASPSPAGLSLVDQFAGAAAEEAGGRGAGNKMARVLWAMMVTTDLLHPQRP